MSCHAVCWYVCDYNPEFPAVPHLSAHISTLISLYVARLVAQQTGRLTFRDTGKDLVIGSGHTFPIVQPGGVCCSLVYTDTNGRGWSRAGGVVEEKHQQ